MKDTATNLRNLNLDAWSPGGQPITLKEALKYASEHYNAGKAIKENKSLQWQKSIPVAVTSRESPGEIGQWRKIGMDKAVYALVCTTWKWAKEPDSEEKTAAIDLLAELWNHAPIDFYYFEVNASLEKKVFLKAFQLMENIRREEEAFAPSGWE